MEQNSQQHLDFDESLQQSNYERDLAIVEMRSKGLTLQEIANNFDVSRERIRQIIKRQNPNLTNSVIKLFKSNQSHIEWLEKKVTIQNSFRRDWDVFKEFSIAEVSTFLDISDSDLQKSVPDIFVQILKGNEEKRNLTVWSDKACEDAIREAGTFHYPLQKKHYENLVSIGLVDGPSVPLLFNRYGSWTAACAAAGVECVPALRDYEKVWTQNDLRNFVSEFLSDRLGVNDSWDNFCDWLKINGEGYPSSATIRNRLGSWREIRSQIYLNFISNKGLDLVKW